MKSRFLSVVSILVFAMLAVTASQAVAQDNSSAAGKKIPMITPVFGQLVMMQYPSGFVPGYEKTRGVNYIMELVPKGETVHKWTQMVTVTGHRDFAANPQMTPERMSGAIAGGFKESCPSTFSAIPIRNLNNIDGYPAFAAVVGCGSHKMKGETYSESALIIVIKGEKDYYTIQWSERGKPQSAAIKHDLTKWVGRFKTLMPVRLCSIVPGEKAPYPSCINKKPAEKMSTAKHT